MLIGKQIMIVSVLIFYTHGIYPAASSNLPDVITIHLKDGSTYPLNSTLTKDPFTQESFKELIAEYAAEGEEYILARATLNNKAKPFAYFDAHSLNRYIFKTFGQINIYNEANPEEPTARYNDPNVSLDYPIDLRNPLKYSITWQALPPRTVSGVRYETVKISDPLTRFQIRSDDDIEYYVFNPKEPLGFVFFCTYKDLINPHEGTNQLFFYANQHDNLILKQQVCFKIGQAYYDGSDNLQQDYKKALYYFSRAASMSNDSQIQIKARYNLALLYFHGDGVAKDYTQALDYFRQGVKQTLNPIIKAQSYYYLGSMYYYALGVPQSFPQAFQYFTTGANQTYDRQTQSACLVALGKMYLYGQGIAKDALRAFQSLTSIINVPDLKPVLKIESSFLLGQMYLFGQGTTIDYAKASNCFISVANQNSNLKLKTASQMYISYMYIFGKGTKSDSKKGLSILNELLKQSVDQPYKKMAEDLIVLADKITKMNETIAADQKRYEESLAALTI